MGGEDKDSTVERLKKELAKLEWEEKLLEKRDDRLKWEQEMLEMEEGLKAKRENLLQEAPSQILDEKREPTPEEPKKPAPSQAELDSGNTYLLLEDTPAKSVQYYINELGNDYKGLFITRSNPVQVKKKHDLGDSKVCWLTGVRAGEEVESVSGLQELSILVSNQIDENNKSVILLDGLEYLISNNDFPIVLRLVQQIRDKVSTSESKMIIPLNSAALDDKQLTLLKRECQLIS